MCPQARQGDHEVVEGLSAEEQEKQPLSLLRSQLPLHRGALVSPPLRSLISHFSPAYKPSPVGEGGFCEAKDG